MVPGQGLFYLYIFNKLELKFIHPHNLFESLWYLTKWYLTKCHPTWSVTPPKIPPPPLSVTLPLSISYHPSVSLLKCHPLPPMYQYYTLNWPHIAFIFYCTLGLMGFKWICAVTNNIILWDYCSYIANITNIIYNRYEINIFYDKFSMIKSVCVI